MLIPSQQLSGDLSLEHTTSSEKPYPLTSRVLFVHKISQISYLSHHSVARTLRDESPVSGNSRSDLSSSVIGNTRKMKTAVVCSCVVLCYLVVVSSQESVTTKLEQDPQKALEIFCKISCRSKERCPELCPQKQTGSWTKRRGPMRSPGIGDLRFDDYLFMKLLGN